MSKHILGIHVGHNASAIIGNEEGILFGIQEERLNGEKNYWGFPELAISACLEHVGKKPSDIYSVVFGRNQIFSRYHSREDVIYSYSRQDSLAGKFRQRYLMPWALKFSPNYGRAKVEKKFEELGFQKHLLNYFDHHTTHAATAYYGLRRSVEEDYLVITCDGSGDGLCATIRVMGSAKSDIIAETEWGNSLGALYSWTTYRMGFVPLEHEYKLMGMAAYTEEKYAREVADIFGSFLGMDDSGLKLKRKALKRISDSSKDIFSKLEGKRFDAICGGLQIFTEEILCEWISNAVEKTGISNVLAAGGVFMNVKANKKISELPNIDSFEAYPSCGDETLAIGAFYQESAKLFGDASVKALDNFYLGDIPEFKPEQEFNYNNLHYYKPENVNKEVAVLIADGIPVARCSGKMEFGARALGNRSILADPSKQDVVRVINQMVKKRDFWMPFAPIMLKEGSENYIKNPKNLRSPYMMMTFDSNNNFKDFIAAVHNADLTNRAQVVEKGQNSDIEEIISEFKKITGNGVLLNTSFNLHGYPIVRTADEAIKVLENSGLTHLQIGDYIVHK